MLLIISRVARVYPLPHIAFRLYAALNRFSPNLQLNSVPSLPNNVLFLISSGTHQSYML